jgi:hypothetical protein
MSEKQKEYPLALQVYSQCLIECGTVVTREDEVRGSVRVRVTILLLAFFLSLYFDFCSMLGLGLRLEVILSSMSLRMWNCSCQ